MAGSSGKFLSGPIIVAALRPLSDGGGRGGESTPPSAPPHHGLPHNRGKDLRIDSRGPQMLLWPAASDCFCGVVLPASLLSPCPWWTLARELYTYLGQKNEHSPRDCMSRSVHCKSDYTLLAIPRQPPASEAECSNPGETRVPPTLRHGEALTSSKYFTGKQKFQWDQIPLKSHNSLFLYINLIFYMNFICFGYSGSSLLCRLFSSWDERGLISSCSSQAAHYRGFSWCRARALGHSGFSSCDPRALEHRLSSCGTRA